MSVTEHSASIDLAREKDFSLGPLHVRPSSRTVSAHDNTETLEPRVMQVLVALARRPGEVVSRDQLIKECWAGRVVGDEAISRCIIKVRRLSETHGGFSLETIPRVGYRLETTQTVPAPNYTAILGGVTRDDRYRSEHSAADNRAHGEAYRKGFITREQNVGPADVRTECLGEASR